MIKATTTLRPRAAAIAGLAMAGLLAAGPGVAGKAGPGDWAVYGGAMSGDRYSTLTQIDRSNVGQLREAWRFETGPGGLQTQPIIIGGVLYGLTPRQEVFALNAGDGTLIWRYAPRPGGSQPVRGLTYWSKGRDARLFTSNGPFLTALDPATGQPIAGFGVAGNVDLRAGLGRPAASVTTALTTPGAIFGDLIIVGFRTAETHPAAPGAVRAYDVRTGALRWTFDLIPKPGQVGSATWPADAWRTAGGANAWTGMVVDARRGIVFVPTGSAVDDFYGGDRAGDNLFANSLVALDARTGRRLWHFQAVHHDILDRDFPSPPVLLTVKRNGRAVDVVAQPTKQGLLFVLDRVTGRPIFPVEERPIPSSDVPGERASPTQPFPLKPAPFARQTLTQDLLTDRTPEANAAAKAAFAKLRSKGPFGPFSLGEQTLVFPGFDGGAEWGGPAVDRARGVIYINSNDIAWTGGLRDLSAAAPAGPGEAVYQQQCAVCHGADRSGQPPTMPSVADVGARLSDAQLRAAITEGRGRMPGFSNMPAGDLSALVQFLKGAPSGREMAPAGAKPGARYAFTGYRKFLDDDGYPAVKPPWGTLSAIDLNTGDYLWKRPLGEYPELAAKGLTGTGSENYGGPVVTASGLLFIGATLYDRKFRAFDSRTGELIWSADLPYAGAATPATYLSGGRQHVVIATSGSRHPKGPQGTAYVAFALPPFKPKN